MDVQRSFWRVLGIALISVPAIGRALADEPPPPGEPPPRVAETDEPKPDKSGYTLFNPVPRSQLRELQTDRPDQTEGPFTVDAGHVQIESDLVNYGYDRSAPGHARVTSQFLDITDVNIRVGVLNHLELDAIMFPFAWERTEDRLSGSASEREGFGDTTLRLKWNFFGDDVGQLPSLAFGIMPYVKLPTNTGHLANHFLEGGLFLPVNLTLPDTWEIGAMSEIDILHDFDGHGGYHPQWVNSIVVHRDIIRDRLNGYVEYYNAASAGHHIGPLEAVDGGFLLAITKDIQLDVGINFGVSKRAPDYNPFVGLSVRF
jgi:hypothetical protein